ncbi:MAG: M1 family aminopeptidase [Thermoanaerobaculia bacterium]|jgi:aminopeptidase N|nr:M1 family aminopeptidase [Thermoanaerobaculia bacterium]
MRRSLPVSLLVALLSGGAAVNAWSDHEGHERLARAGHPEGRAKRARALVSELARSRSGRGALSPEGAARGYDVLTYDLRFELDPAVVALEGSAVIRLAAIRPGVSEVRLDLDDAMSVRGVERDGSPVTTFTAAGDVLTVPLTPPLGAEERTTLVVRWGGTPLAGGALTFWTAPASGPAISSLAEPFDARTFWPCVDDPADKAVVTLSATVPSGYVAVSAGRGASTSEPDGRVTWRWRLPQPISTYLVSVAVGRFEEIAVEYRTADGRTMPVVGWVVPEHAAPNRARVASMVRHLEVLSSLFGDYPYLDTKYGIVEGSFSGGMEHPTITLIGASLLGNASRDLTDLLVHELAHQWWGDEVTMRTWDDIWLNEGFATYAEVLYRERTSSFSPGLLLASRYDDGLYSGQLGPAVVAPPSDPFRHTGAVYSKGAWVLHMLRRRIGDDAFFAAVREYRRRHERGNATRGDLRAVFEEVSGRDLKQHFDQWVETPYRPILRATFRNVSGGADVNVRQVQAHAVVHPQAGPDDVPHYVFPLTLRLFTASGGSKTATVEVTRADETFFVPLDGGSVAVAVALDPDGDLLDIVEAVGPAL